MPITYTIDHQRRLIRAEVVGDYSLGDMLATVKGAGEDVGERGFNVLSDHRHIGEPITREQIDRLVAVLESMRDVFAGSRWAVIVREQVSFGMMRMFGAVAERIPMYVRPFTDPVLAEAWAVTGDDLRDGLRSEMAPPSP